MKNIAWFAFGAFVWLLRFVFGPFLLPIDIWNGHITKDGAALSSGLPLIAVIMMGAFALVSGINMQLAGAGVFTYFVCAFIAAVCIAIESRPRGDVDTPVPSLPLYILCSTVVNALKFIVWLPYMTNEAYERRLEGAVGEACLVYMILMWVATFAVPFVAHLDPLFYQVAATCYVFFGVVGVMLIALARSNAIPSDSGVWTP